MGSIFKHYKGGIYNSIGVGTHTESGEEYAIYEDLNGRVWLRPLDMFKGEVEVNGEKVYRFQKIGQFKK